MNARDLFPQDEEYQQVKEIVRMFNGRVVEVVDSDKKVLYRDDYAMAPLKKVDKRIQRDIVV